jgi:DNA-binding NarL/FixJ family response regulator
VAEPIRVLIVDDHAVVRQGLRSFLELQDGMTVVGEAEDGEEAVAAAERLRPDVVLMDLVMPKVDGVEAMRRLRERVPAARVIVLTSFLEDERLLPAVRAGAAGYLLKNAQPQELARAIRTAHEGEALIDPAVAARLVDALAAGRPPRRPDAARAGGARVDRARVLEQADRTGARRRREDGQEPRLPRAREARRGRPDAGGAVRQPSGTAVLGPIPDSGRDRAGPMVRACQSQSSPEPRAGSASP